MLPLHQGGTRGKNYAHRQSAIFCLGTSPIQLATRGNHPGNNGDMTDASFDTVDDIVSAWSRERPELDFTPLEVLSRVWRISHRVERVRKASFEKCALESWEFDVLAALRRAGHPFELSPKELLEQTLVSSGTMTNRVDRLTARGLVERRNDPNDGRAVRVRMTQDGLARVDAAITELVVAERGLLEGLSPAEQARLAALLKKLGSGLL